MKFSIRILLALSLCVFVISCKKKEHSWEVEVSEPQKKVEIIDISKKYYDPQFPLEEFNKEFPFFQGSVSNKDMEVRRKDSVEVKIYRDAISKINLSQLQNDFTQLFVHVQHYFPEFKTPKVMLYSSALQGVEDPIFYRGDVGMLFVDITAFMGSKSPYYQNIDLYLKNSMNPENIIPKASYILAEEIVPFDRTQQKFIDQMMYFGKIMTLQDAFLPKQPDYLKMNYTPEQLKWAKENEVNIWNFFVEKNLLFSDDPQLSERFLAIAPFSKFYTEIDTQSSPQIGIWEAWQIARKYYQENPETSLEDFLQMSATDIFNQSNYKP